MAEIKSYAMVDKDGNIMNVSGWDGVTPYTPPEGLTMVEVTGAAGIAEIGGIVVAGKFKRAPVVEE